MNNRAMVILSGGQDSTTCLFWAKMFFDEVQAITFAYGQRHDIEIDCAKHIAKRAGVKHQVVSIPGLLKSTSPLTDPKAELEKYENAKQMESVIGNRVELTFVPMRNTLFLTIGANYALAEGMRTLVTGICQEDNANYPDCTEPFRRKLERSFNESLGIQDFRIEAPLMHLSKADSVRLASRLPGCLEALAYSHTSYDGKYPPTDMNHANVLRAAGFEEAGVPDPLVVRAWKEGLMELPKSSNYKDVPLNVKG
jgi:7-cyano-7-deazaguanine synthase